MATLADAGRTVKRRAKQLFSIFVQPRSNFVDSGQVSDASTSPKASAVYIGVENIRHCRQGPKMLFDKDIA